MKPGNTYIIYTYLSIESDRLAIKRGYCGTREEVPWVAVEELKVDISKTVWYIF